MHKATQVPTDVWNPDATPTIHGLAHWEWNIPENSVYFSREWQHILLSQDETILGPSTVAWWGRVHEDDVLPFLAMAKDIADGRTDEYQTLFRVSRTDGSWAWLFSRGTVTRKYQGMAVLVCGTLMDISSLRSDIKFQHGSQSCASGDAILAYSPDLIVRMDEDLTPLFTNPRIARSLTRSTEQQISENGGSPPGFDPVQLQFLKDNVRKVFSTGLSAQEQITLPTLYGHDVTGEYSFWPEFDGHGNVIAVLTQFRDLTDRILAERRAKLNEMRLEALYRLSQLDSAEEGQVLDFVMESLIRLTGSDSGFLFFPHEGCGSIGRLVWSKSIHALVESSRLPRKQLPRELLELVSNGKPVVHRLMTNGSGVYPLLRAFGGALKVIRFISAPVLDRGGIVCIAGVFNKESRYEEADLQQLEAFVNSAWHIIRRHQFVNALQKAKEAAELANRKLQQAIKIAEDASRVKNAFLANVSHELRTPLNGVLGMLQLLDDMPLPWEQRKYVETARASGQALLRIISDLLDLSSIEADKFILLPERISLGPIIRSSIDIFRHEASQKGLEIALEMDDDGLPEVYGDEARLQQIIFNIVGNALKFTEQGKIIISCSPMTSSKDGEILVSFSVQDSGIGIPAQMQDKIFEAFTQVDTASIKKYPGTGLGLCIVKRLMDITGGSISLESDIGVGTTVSCIFKFRAATPLTQENTTHAPEKSPSAPAEAMDILVAEDDPTSRFALAAFLRRLGHKATCVENGRQALEALQLHRFDCLFTDIQMPAMDGLELIKRIREKEVADIPPTDATRALLREKQPGSYDSLLEVEASMPVVSVSAHAMAGDKDRFLTMGMDFYISKPILLKDLRNVLEKIAGRLRETAG